MEYSKKKKEILSALIKILIIHFQIVSSISSFDLSLPKNIV